MPATRTDTPAIPARGKTLRERLSIRRRHTVNSPTTRKPTLKERVNILRSATLPASLRTRRTGERKPLRERVPSRYRRRYDATAPVNQDEDSLSMLTFNSETTALSYIPGAIGSLTGRAMARLGEAALNPIENILGRKHMLSLVHFFSDIDSDDRALLDGHFERKMFFKDVIECSKSIFPSYVRTQAHAAYDMYMWKASGSVTPPISLFCGTFEYLFFIVEQLEYARKENLSSRYVGILNMTGKLTQVLQSLKIAETEPRVQDVKHLHLDRVRDTIFDAVSHAPVAAVLELLALPTAHYDTLQAACLAALMKHLGKDSLRMDECMDALQLCHRTNEFFILCFKDITFGVSILQKMSEIDMQFDQSVLDIASGQFLRQCLQQRGSLLQWIDYLTMADGFTFSDRHWKMLHSLQKFVDPTIFLEDVLAPLIPHRQSSAVDSHWESWQEQRDLQRIHYKAQEICFNLDQFPFWNENGFLTLRVFAEKEFLSAALRLHIIEDVKKAFFQGNRSKFFSCIENGIGWDIFIKLMVQEVKDQPSENLIQACARRSAAVDILFAVWRQTPSPLVLSVYEAVLEEERLSRTTGASDSHLTHLINLLVEEPPEVLMHTSCWEALSSTSSAQAYLKFCIHSAKCFDNLKSLLDRTSVTESDVTVRMLVRETFINLQYYGFASVLDHLTASMLYPDADRTAHDNWRVLRGILPPDLIVKEVVRHLQMVLPLHDTQTARRKAVAERVWLTVRQLELDASDSCILIRFLRESTLMEDSFRFPIFAELKFRVETLDEKGEIQAFMGQVEECMGWKQFVSVLLDEISDLREIRALCIRSLAKDILSGFYMKSPSGLALESLVREVQRRPMADYLKAWIAEHLPQHASLFDESSPSRCATTVPQYSLIADPSDYTFEDPPSYAALDRPVSPRLIWNFAEKVGSVTPGNSDSDSAFPLPSPQGDTTTLPIVQAVGRPLGWNSSEKGDLTRPPNSAFVRVLPSPPPRVDMAIPADIPPVAIQLPWNSSEKSDLGTPPDSVTATVLPVPPSHGVPATLPHPDILAMASAIVGLIQRINQQTMQEPCIVEKAGLPYLSDFYIQPSPAAPAAESPAPHTASQHPKELRRSLVDISSRCPSPSPRGPRARRTKSKSPLANVTNVPLRDQLSENVAQPIAKPCLPRLDIGKRIVSKPASPTLSSTESGSPRFDSSCSGSPVIIHSIPTAFSVSPASPSIQRLVSQNFPSSSPPPHITHIRWLASKSKRRGKRHSSIVIYLHNKEDAAKLLQQEFLWFDNRKLRVETYKTPLASGGVPILQENWVAKPDLHGTREEHCENAVPANPAYSRRQRQRPVQRSQKNRKFVR